MISASSPSCRHSESLYLHHKSQVDDRIRDGKGHFSSRKFAPQIEPSGYIRMQIRDPMFMSHTSLRLTVLHPLMNLYEVT